MHRNAKRALIAGTLGVVFLGNFAGACDEAVQDADKSGQKVDKTAAEVFAMPDGFRNVATKCDHHGHRIYSGSTGNSGTYATLFVIEDPTCPGGGSR